MRRPPIKPSAESEAVLMREAQLRLESKTIKEIAYEIGASKAYVQGRLSSLVAQLKRQNIVPRGTGDGLE